MNYAIPSFRQVDMVAVGAKEVKFENISFYVPGYFVEKEISKPSSKVRLFSNGSNGKIIIIKTPLSTIQKTAPQLSLKGVYMLDLIQKMRIVKGTLKKPIDYMAMVYNQGNPSFYMENKLSLTSGEEGITGALHASDGVDLYSVIFAIKEKDANKIDKQLFRDILQTVHYKQPNTIFTGMGLNELLKK